MIESYANNNIRPLLSFKKYMKKNFKAWSIALILMTVMSIWSCTDNQNFSTNPNHRLEFSTDTVAFDTLFTEVSSATKAFLIYNRNKADLRIAQATLSGGESSPYRVNIDGLAGTTFSNLSLRGGDSMFVFVEATIDPRGENTPFEVKDSLLFALEGGVTQQVLLTASGQDATVLRSVVITADTTLTAERPYLIYDSLKVLDSATLYIEPGAQLYFADKVELQVYGRIEAVGTADSLIIFRGARTDRMFSYLPYDRLSAQWGGITLHESSTDNLFVHCDIHSGTYGLRAKGSDIVEHKVTMHNSQIHNVNEDALQLMLCKAAFTNSLFTNAGGHCVNILGGQMDFVHCTMANFFPWKSERGVAVNIVNYIEEENTLYPLLGVNFINSIITGSKEDELMGIVVAKTDTTDWSEYAQYHFSHSLINSWKEARDPDTLHFSHIVWEHKDSTAYGNTNFRTIDYSNFIFDFHLDSLSVARGIATDEYLDLLPCDKDEQERLIETIDAGCYQYVEYAKEEKK